MPNTETVAAIATILLIRRRRRRKKTCLYVRGINLTRLSEGDFHQLISPMRTRFPVDHFNYIRMMPTRFDHLLMKVGPLISHPPNHRMPISPKELLAITLRFLADSSSLSTLQYSYRVGRSTVSSIIKETTVAIWTALKDEYLKPPTRDEWIDIAKEFWTKWNFPLCVGAIDGKHIAIRNPSHAGSMHFCYKCFFSIVLLAVVDANYKFIFVDVGGYGREGDAGLFHQFSFSERLMSPTQPYSRGGLGLPYDNCLPGTGIVAPHVFLGDEAFPLMRCLMKPYRCQSASDRQQVFYYRLSRARRIVENAFGILTRRWRVLAKRIDVNVSTTDSTVKACICLHNYLKSTDAVDHQEPLYIPRNYVDYENAEHILVHGDWRLNSDHNYGLTPFETITDPLQSHWAVRETSKHISTARKAQFLGRVGSRSPATIGHLIFP